MCTVPSCQVIRQEENTIKKITHISPTFVEEYKRCKSKLHQDQQDEKKRVLFTVKETKGKDFSFPK